MKYLIYLALLISTTILATPISIPNTFIAGQAAVADEVNDNFSAMVNGVNANMTAIVNNTTTIATTNDGITTLIGEVSTNAFNIGSNAFNISTNAEDIAANTTAITALENIPPPSPTKSWHVEDANGVDLGTLLNNDGTVITYITNNAGGLVRKTRLDWGRDGNRQTLYYDTVNCSGTPYTRSGNGTILSIPYSTGTSDKLYYVSRGATARSVGQASYKTSSTTCTNSTGPAMDLFPAMRYYSAKPLRPLISVLK